MKTVNYKLQTQIESIKPENTLWFRNYLKEVLESDKPYHVKADYVGLSFIELQRKIDTVKEDIRELKVLQKKLELAKATAQEIAAEVITEYGIDRLDGTQISSITVTPQKETTTDALSILDEEALIALGYTKVEVTLDKEAVESAMHTVEGMDEIDHFVKIESVTKTTPAKIRINTRKSVHHPEAEEMLDWNDAVAA